MTKQILLGCLLLCAFATTAQTLKPHLSAKPKNDLQISLKDIAPIQGLQPIVPSSSSYSLFGTGTYQPLPGLNKLVSKGSLMVELAPDTQLPIYIKGKIPAIYGSKNDVESQAYAYLDAVKGLLKIENPQDAFEIQSIETDVLGQTHIRLQQYFYGIEVYGGEIILHAWDDQVQLLNGRYYPIPTLSNVNPSISSHTAIERAIQDISKTVPLKPLTDWEQRLIEGKQVAAELVIYHPNRDINAERLAWAITLYPNVAHRWAYFVDAQTGAVIHKFAEVCRIHHECHTNKHSLSNAVHPIANEESPVLLPPRTATAQDLFNINRTINTWQEGSTYYLIDASRSMFNATQSAFPDDPVGVIWTINAQNTSPQNDNFAADHVRSNNNTWTNKTSISAHYNAGKAFEYFQQKFNRNSINGRGGNIISLINVVEEDGSQMDNAFWNGAAMFYGNGNQAFNAPLAKALDVGGHEMSHGVIQNTANLEYQGESGAINESFADIFGAMIDRDDWKMGEDITNPQFFPTGALRDLSNPNNGGTKFGDPGWQPDRLSQKYTGTQDNGGVHINSGITNRAFFLFATQVGKDKAEQVYYRALTNYLTRSSQFIDLRIAVLQAATDLHGANSAEVNAAANAFTTVGIVGNQGGDYEQEVESNDGQEFILYADEEFSSLSIVTPSGQAVAVPISNIGPLSKPSITDDGSIIVYVGEDKKLYALVIDWQAGTFEQPTLNNEAIWHNAAISKDGTKIAALFDDAINDKIFVFDLINGSSEEFQVYNPTYTEGIETGEVVFIDALEWDFSGEFVMYDAQNSIQNAGSTIEYWDIGFIKVWNNATNTFGNGFVSKLFSGLQEGISVGNPTFSKNSPHIISFDYLDAFDETFYILGVNLETNEVGIIYENSDVSYPNYAVQDDRLIFDALSTQGNNVVGVVELNANKIEASTDPPTAFVLVSDNIRGARWGVWFANGERDLTSIAVSDVLSESMKVFPNPFEERIYLQLDLPVQATVRVELFDLLGKRWYTEELEASAGLLQKELFFKALPAGTYSLRTSIGPSAASRKIVKLR